MTLRALWSWLWRGSEFHSWSAQVKAWGDSDFPEIQPLTLPPVIDIRSTVTRHRKRKPSRSDVIRMKARS